MWERETLFAGNEKHARRATPAGRTATARGDELQALTEDAATAAGTHLELTAEGQ